MKNLKYFEEFDFGNQLEDEKSDEKPVRYMFFKNLKTIKEMIDELLEMDTDEIDGILEEHDWACDHIATSRDDIQDVYNFLKGEDVKDNDEDDDIRIQMEDED